MNRWCAEGKDHVLALIKHDKLIIHEFIMYYEKDSTVSMKAHDFCRTLN